ncbi:MAG: DNA gyrase C-terminal beta-propeller domain-containing protein, partial [Dehalococcoidales bacterium]
ELKREAQPQQVLNGLYKYTAMQSSFFVNMLALVDGQPRVLSLKEVLKHYIDFRRRVVTRRSKFELKVARSRAHILEGLKVALDNIDRVIAIIRKSKNVEAARLELAAEFGLSQAQTQAILEIQLRRLAHLERQKILDEYAEVLKSIGYLEDLLANPKRMMQLIKEELKETRSRYADERRTEVMEQGVIEFTEEDLIPHQRMVVTLSDRGFVKRVPSQAYRVQHRGGKGIIGMVTREKDAVRFLVVTDTHDRLLFFSSRGKIFSIKCYEAPADSSRVAKGMAVVNLFPVAESEKITSLISYSEVKPGCYLLMATKQGEIKKTSLEEFTSVRSSGLLAMDLATGDELVAAQLATDDDDVLLVTGRGQSIRFPVKSLRTSLRASGGVRAIRLGAGDEVVSMDVAQPDGFVLVVTEGGFGKLSPVADYPRQQRAGTGVRTFNVVDKTGNVVAARVVSHRQQLMIISADGIVTRTPVKEKDPKKGITVQGRSTQGVRLMRLAEGDRVVAIACLG